MVPLGSAQILDAYSEVVAVQSSMPWYLLVIAIPAWFAGLPGWTPSVRGAAGRAALVGLLFAACGYAVTWPSTPPFATGQGLGAGFAVGAIGAALAFIPLLRLPTASASRALIALAAMLAPALVAVWCVYAFLGSTRLYGLTGIFLGWAATSAALSCRQIDDDAAPSRTAWMVASVVFLGLVSILLMLTVYRAAELAMSYRWANLILRHLSVGIACILLASAAASRVREGSALLAGAIVAAGMSVYASLQVPRVADWLRLEGGGSGLALALVVGLVGGFFLGWFAVTRRRPISYADAGVAALLGVGVALPGLRVAVGTGAAMALVSAMLSALALLCAHSAHLSENEHADEAEAHAGTPVDAGSVEPIGLMAAALMPALALLAVRLTVERHGADFRGFGVSDHMQVAALLLGLLLPGVLAGLSRSASVLGRAVDVAVWLAWPLAVAVLWGPRIVYALIIGLGLAPLLGVVAADRTALWGHMTLGAAIGIGGLLQFGAVALKVNELTRVERVQILAVAVVCIGATYALAHLSGARRKRGEA